uniref:Uncharacterized protein n=1 Tax=Cacopsylla melanoneura TaxID=428564 RepID=A0A8D8VWG8_9HEMI
MSASVVCRQCEWNCVTKGRYISIILCTYCTYTTYVLTKIAVIRLLVFTYLHKSVKPRLGGFKKYHIGHKGNMKVTPNICTKGYFLCRTFYIHIQLTILCLLHIIRQPNRC